MNSISRFDLYTTDHLTYMLRGIAELKSTDFLLKISIDSKTEFSLKWMASQSPYELETSK